MPPLEVPEQKIRDSLGSGVPSNVADTEVIKNCELNKLNG